MTTAYLLNYIRAHKMIVAGYINTIVVLESKLPMKTVRNLKAILRSEGHIKPCTERTLRSGFTIIRNAAVRQDATLLMLIYRELMGADAAQHSIKIDFIDQAYALYVAAKQEVTNGLDNELLSINDAYSLAKELRSCEADFTTCSKCSSEYFISYNQRSSENCPFCSKRKQYEVAPPVAQPLQRTG